MSTFRTLFTPTPSQKRISLSDRVLTIGSCFSDAIGSHLVSNKITCSANPFGTLYNPFSIHKAVQYAVLNEPVPEDTFLQRNDIFFNYDFHSEISSLNLSQLKTQLKTMISQSHSFLQNARWLIITYGTAWVYERTDNNSAVANCHKMPQSLFTKTLMTQKKLLESFGSMYESLKAINSDINVLLTVSPVRHIKDTLELNSVSKAVLRVACHTLTQQYSEVHYFPSYEIMMDDLRDYRFYKADMIHPTQLAEEYIFTKFADQYFNDELRTFILRWKEIKAALAHKPFHPASLPHQQFLKESLRKLEELKGLVNVDEEIEIVKKQLR
ncbi:MAG TPA: GSCFA domain-containing protein [Chryseolinea sp.]|nr:GSCFA domain-containing protein [Chryseolinea sp.]